MGLARFGRLAAGIVPGRVSRTAIRSSFSKTAECRTKRSTRSYKMGETSHTKNRLLQDSKTCFKGTRSGMEEAHDGKKRFHRTSGKCRIFRTALHDSPRLEGRDR